VPEEVSPGSKSPRELPWPIRAWLALDARGPRGRRLALRLARSLLEPRRPYRTPKGFVLRIDPADPIFQPAMLLGLFDPVVEAVIRTFARPGCVAIDAGAHIGYFTMLMADAVGPEGSVHAFECDPRIVSQLRDNVALSDLAWVNVNDSALWSCARDELVMQLTEMPGWSYLDRGMWQPIGSATVSAVALDGYLRARKIEPRDVGFIKLDVEGAEPEALAGMRATLAETQAAVLIEFQRWAMLADESRQRRILDLMAAYDYRPFSPSRRREGGLKLVPGVAPTQGEDVLFLK
jgi:FkbM family methyltransferase